MARIVLNKQSCGVFDDEVDPAELGVETEAEKQMKVILDRQLNTSLSMKEQFAQHRTFVTPSTYKPLTELVRGTCSHEKFRELEHNQELYQELQRCGLSEIEIKDYLAFKSGKKHDSRIVNPAVYNEWIANIEAKIQAHNEDLSRPQDFANVKKLTRHEMDLEKTLYAGCKNKHKLPPLLALAKEESSSDSYMDGAFMHVKELSKKLLLKSKKRKKSFHPESNVDSDHDAKEDFCYDSNVHHVVVPLDKDEIASNKLSLDQIKELPRFKDYEPGELNKILFIKNLHAKATDRELRSIFGHFEKTEAIEYRVCSGRMKGQAFVKFKNAEIAKEALSFANGYLLRGKPIIIHFGRKS